jgi:hypothetical protein
MFIVEPHVGRGEASRALGRWAACQAAKTQLLAHQNRMKYLISCS